MKVQRNRMWRKVKDPRTNDVISERNMCVSMWGSAITHTHTHIRNAVIEKLEPHHSIEQSGQQNPSKAFSYLEKCRFYAKRNETLQSYVGLTKKVNILEGFVGFSKFLNVF